MWLVFAPAVTNRRLPARAGHCSFPPATQKRFIISSNNLQPRRRRCHKYEKTFLTGRLNPTPLASRSHATAGLEGKNKLQGDPTKFAVLSASTSSTSSTSSSLASSSPSSSSSSSASVLTERRKEVKYFGQHKAHWSICNVFPRSFGRSVRSDGDGQPACPRPFPGHRIRHLRRTSVRSPKRQGGNQKVRGEAKVAGSNRLQSSSPSPIINNEIAIIVIIIINRLQSSSIIIIPILCC